MIFESVCKSTSTFNPVSAPIRTQVQGKRAEARESRISRLGESLRQQFAHRTKLRQFEQWRRGQTRANSRERKTTLDSQSERWFCQARQVALL